LSGTWAPLFLKRDNPASRIICLQQCLFNLRLFYAASCGLVSRIFLLLYDYIAEPAICGSHLETSSTKTCRMIEVIRKPFVDLPRPGGRREDSPKFTPEREPRKTYRKVENFTFWARPRGLHPAGGRGGRASHFRIFFRNEIGDTTEQHFWITSDRGVS